jgi:hypothetical protein
MDEVLATNRRALADGADAPNIFMQNAAVVRAARPGPAALDELDRAYAAGWRDGRTLAIDPFFTSVGRSHGSSSSCHASSRTLRRCGRGPTTPGCRKSQHQATDCRLVLAMGLRASEWIIVAYFAYLAGAAAVVPSMSRLQRRRAIGLATAVLIAVFTIAAFGTKAMLWRDWMPLLYIVIGYRLPALLVTA